MDLHLDDFEYTPEKKEDYLLFLGRVYEGKGVHIAIQVAEKKAEPPAALPSSKKPAFSKKVFYCYISSNLWHILV